MGELRFGRDRVGDAATASRTEWLVTNGAGGYAMGTVSGALTRRYHGLLVAALDLPLQRTLLLAKLAERVYADGQWVDLDHNLWADGTCSPDGLLKLESFVLEDGLPRWTWALDGLRLEKRVWMEPGENTTYVRYHALEASEPLALSLRALVNHRAHHARSEDPPWTPRVEAVAGGTRIALADELPPLWLFLQGATVTPQCTWYRDFAYPREGERGLEDAEDHLLVAELEVELAPGEAVTVVASTRHDAGLTRGSPLPLLGALRRRRAHTQSLREAWERAQGPLARRAPAWIRNLVVTADSFVVARPEDGDALGRSLLSGYPWLSDRGRDVFAALPGLTLVTGRVEVARSILVAMARRVAHGRVPGPVPEQGGVPAPDTADAALWLYPAVEAFAHAGGDEDTLSRLYAVLEDIGAWLERGTGGRFGVDPQDFLLRAGGEAEAATWMDARVQGVPVTPRRGKPVELNALWFHALSCMARLSRRLGRPPETYADMARRVEASFARYWCEDTGSLHDVLDTPEGPDSTLRPNQLLAISLTDSPLEAHRRRAVLDAVSRSLHVSFGVRTLAPAARDYVGMCTGTAAERARAAHQGTAWTWLLPHLALARFRVTGERVSALALLEPLGDLVRSATPGTLPEACDGDAPHAWRGAPSHALAVAETLRAWHLIAGAGAKPRRGVRRERKLATTAN